MSEILPDSQRIVITGLGAISPVGLTAEESWQAIIKGQSGIALIEPEKERSSRVQIAGQVKGFDPSVCFSDPKELKGTSRAVQFATATVIEALTGAGLLVDGKFENVDPNKIGLRIGSIMNGSSHIIEIQDTIRNKGDHWIAPLSMLRILSGRIVSVPSIKLGIKGPICAVSTECASGLTAITDATLVIKAGDADVMVAGGAEAAIYQIIIGSFAAGRALSTRNDSPKEASRPFDKEADGFVVAEGAGMVVLERLDYARARGAEIIAEVAGYGSTADAYDNTNPSGEGAVRAMRIALNRAGINPVEVDYINAHGTSTVAGDGVELDAIAEVFGKAARKVLISSTKGAVGHLLGAAGGLETVMCTLAIRDGIAPPTLNLRNPIRESLDLVSSAARKRPINIALNNSFGLGGFNSVLALRKFVS